MAFLEWNPAFDTGVRAIDYEHRKLVDLLNEVDEQLRGGNAHAEVTGTLGEFHSLATAHLALEERILRDLDDPRFTTRRRRHYQLLDQVREIMDGFERGQYQGLTALPEALRDWLAELMHMDATVFTTLDEAKLGRWGLSRKATSH